MGLSVKIRYSVADARADDSLVLDNVAIEIFDDDVENLDATIAQGFKFRAIKVNRAVKGDFYGFDIHQGRE